MGGGKCNGCAGHNVRLCTEAHSSSTPSQQRRMQAGMCNAKVKAAAQARLAQKPGANKRK